MDLSTASRCTSAPKSKISNCLKCCRCLWMHYIQSPSAKYLHKVSISNCDSSGFPNRSVIAWQKVHRRYDQHSHSFNPSNRVCQNVCTIVTRLLPRSSKHVRLGRRQDEWITAAYASIVTDNGDVQSTFSMQRCCKGKGYSHLNVLFHLVSVPTDGHWY